MITLSNRSLVVQATKSDNMLNFTYRGLCAPVFTFFNADHSINVGIIPKYAKFLADHGVNGVLVHGTSGEAMSMTVAERKAVVEEWVKAVKVTKQHLMVQVAGCPLPDALDLARHAESVGVDSILSLPELYFKPTTPLAVVNYLKHIGDAAPKTPLLYYHIPGWTAVDINVAEMMNLAVDRLPTFVGIKYTSNDLDKGVAALRVNNGKFAVFLGADTLMAGAFTMGFDSAIATTLNFLPDYAVGIQKAIRENRVEEARKLQDSLSDACGVITRDGAWVPTMKVAMNLVTGINPGPARPPLVNITTAETEKMRNSLKSLKIVQ